MNEIECECGNKAEYRCNCGVLLCGEDQCPINCGGSVDKIDSMVLNLMTSLNGHQSTMTVKEIIRTIEWLYPMSFKNYIEQRGETNGKNKRI